jgi:hypothetical protein
MKTEVGRNCSQSIHFDYLSCRQVSFSHLTGLHHERSINVLTQHYDVTESSHIFFYGEKFIQLNRFGGRQNVLMLLS